MDKNEILKQIILADSDNLDDFNELSDDVSTYGCVIAKTNTHSGSGMTRDIVDISEAIDLLTRTEIWELNIKLADAQIPLVLADSPGVKPDRPRPGRPN